MPASTRRGPETDFFRIRSLATGGLAALRFGGTESAEAFMAEHGWPRDQYVIERESDGTRVESERREQGWAWKPSWAVPTGGRVPGTLIAAEREDDTSERLLSAEAAETCNVSSDGEFLLLTLNGRDFKLTVTQAEALTRTLDSFIVSEFVSDRDERPEFDSPGEREQAYQDGILGSDVCEQCGEVFAGPTCVDCSDGE